MTNNIKKRVLIFLLIFIVGSIAGIAGYSTSKINTFEKCEASWLVRSITHYDYAEYAPDAIEKKCTLWTGKSFVKLRTHELTENQKRAVEIATAHLSYPTTVIEAKELECDGCFSVKLQRDDNQQQFTITLNDWKIEPVDQSKSNKYCNTDEDCVLWLCTGCVNKEWAKTAPSEPPCARYEGYRCQCVNNKCIEIK